MLTDILQFCFFVCFFNNHCGKIKQINPFCVLAASPDGKGMHFSVVTAFFLSTNQFCITENEEAFSFEISGK